MFPFSLGLINQDNGTLELRVAIIFFWCKERALLQNEARERQAAMRERWRQNPLR